MEHPWGSLERVRCGVDPQGTPPTGFRRARRTVSRGRRPLRAGICAPGGGGRSPPAPFTSTCCAGVKGRGSSGAWATQAIGGPVLPATVHCGAVVVGANESRVDAPSLLAWGSVDGTLQEDFLPLLRPAPALVEWTGCDGHDTPRRDTPAYPGELYGATCASVAIPVLAAGGPTSPVEERRRDASPDSTPRRVVLEEPDR